jgi:hypothetical protein
MRTVLSILFLSLMGMVGAAGATTAADLPYVTLEMYEPDYWVLHQAAPDRVVMTPQQIAMFNRGLYAQSLTDDMVSFPAMLPGEKVKVEVQRLAMSLSMKDLFRYDGLKADESFYGALTQNMALDVLRDRVRVRYAFTTAFTDERILPTDEPLYEKPGDVHFDQLQNSGIDPATPVLVLHESADGQWLFIKDGNASGWVKRGKIAFTDKAMWLKRVAGKKLAVITSARAPIYLDGSMDVPVAEARMGSRFIVKRVKPYSVEIVYPLRHEDGTVRFVSAFIFPRDMIQGVLPYTARMVIVQAFKLLDAPYGWGDMNGDQDCSRFIQMVFATMGLELPRNSAEQGRSGLSLAEFNTDASIKEKSALIFSEGEGALTLLRLKGHIMLYLGKDNGRPYVIHAAWAYRQKGPEGDEVKVLGRVVVSDLSLGEGSSKGSLLERIVAVRLLKPDTRGVKDNH